MAYVSKIKDTNENILDIKSKITSAIPYGECDSTSTATVFTATVDGITALYDGVCCLLKNGVKTSASGFTININGLGAKPVYSNLATGNDITPTDPTRDTTIFNINYTMFLIYSTTLVEGGAWICYRGYDSNSNDTGYYIRHSYATLPVSDTARYYKLYFTSADNTKWVPSSVHSANNATAARPVNQRPINPFGKIVYTSASTNYTAGSNLGVSYAWEQYPFTLGYAFNRIGAALTLTYPAPVYIKCAPQADGSAIIDEDVPYVQALPTNADGKIYIFLGIAYEATKVELYQDHPIYYHDGVSIKPWPGTMILGEEPLYSENSTPYKFRQIEDDGLASKELLEKIVGGSLAWNQMIDTQSFTSTTDDTRDFLNLTTRVYNGSTYQYILIKQLTQPTLVESILNPSYSNRIEILHNGATRNIQIYNNSNNVKNFNAIAGHKYFCSFDCKGVDVKTVGGLVIDDMMFIDLTQVFGTTIADYVYSLETATEGAGVAWLKRYIDLNTYYSYDTGSMKIIEGLTSHNTIELNQYTPDNLILSNNSGITKENDGSLKIQTTAYQERENKYYVVNTNYPFRIECDIETLTNSGNNAAFKIHTYYQGGISGQQGITLGAVGNKQHISFTTNNDYQLSYFAFGGWSYTGSVKITNLCVFIHKDTSRDGVYEPYIKHSYPLDSTVKLRGYPILDTNNNLNFDGDEYFPTGKINRQYGIIDLGTLNWTYYNTIPYFQASLPSGAEAMPSINQGYDVKKEICSKYNNVSWRSLYNATTDKGIASNSNGTIINVADSAYTDATAFKTAMSGVYFIYKLAQPTIEYAAPYQRIQDIDNWGTQEFVTTSIVPVGHLTRYPKNLIALTEQISDTISVLPTTTTPIMDGTASVGTEREYARGDHIHPTDTTRQATLVSGTNIKTINNTSLLGSGNISTPNTTYAVATTAANGLMSSTDKSNLNSAYAHAVTNKGTSAAAGLYKIKTNSEGHVTGTTVVTKADITALGIPGTDTNTTYAAATTGAAGLMSSTDKAKLDSIASSATRNTFSSFAGAPTGNQTPSFGGTFNIYQVGQTTAGALTTTARTVTIPNSTATTAAAGLMPKISGSTAQMLNGAGSWVDIPASYWVYNSTNDTIELVFPS